MKLLHLAGLFLAALAMRLLTWPVVFSARGVLPGGLMDEYYHLRRIWYSVVHFPEILSFDPYVNFPEGGHVVWPPGFDWLVAVLAWLLVGAEDQTAVETVAVWVPPVLGAFTVVIVALVAQASFGGAAGAIAGILLAFLPVNWVFSALGSVDHHVAVALGGAVLLGTAMVWLRERGPRAASGLSLALGLALSLPLLVWPGYLIHVGVAQAGLVAATLGAADRKLAVDRAWSLAGAHAAATAVVLPFCLGPALPQYGAWSPLVLSWFQPAWLGAGAVALAVAALLWCQPASGATRARRVAVAAGLGLVGIGMALLLVSDLRDAVLYASGWFTRSHEVRGVVELKPLELGTAANRYSLGFFFFPLAWVVVAVSALRTRAWDRGFLLLWAATFLALALHQRRFNNSFAVPYVLVWGGALVWGLSALRPHLAGRAARSILAAALGGALLLGLLSPVAGFYETFVQRSVKALRYPDQVIAALSPWHRVHLGAADWLARSTPPTRGYLDVDLQPEYGVISPWSAGHMIRYVSERPLVQDNFGVYGGVEGFTRAAAYYGATDEAEAVALLERLRVRYVVASFGAGRHDASGPGSLSQRLSRLFGTAGTIEDLDTGRSVEVPALVHHRLVYHARSVPGESLVGLPPRWAAAVFERVAGARVEGRAPPGAQVEARLLVTTQAGRQALPRAQEPLIYRVLTRADPDGRYALTLPYPTDGPFSDSVRTGSSYRLSAAGASARLEVPEAAVQTGARVEAPPLLAGSRAPPPG